MKNVLSLLLNHELLDGRGNVLKKMMADLLSLVFPLALSKVPINHGNYFCLTDEETECLQKLVDYLKTIQPEKEKSGFTP